MIESPFRKFYKTWVIWVGLTLQPKLRMLMLDGLGFGLKKYGTHHIRLHTYPQS